MATACSGRRRGVSRHTSGAILTEQSAAKSREPIFNIPAPIVASVAVLVLVHAVRLFLLTDEQDIDFVLTFGFIPARYRREIPIGSPRRAGCRGRCTFFP